MRRLIVSLLLVAVACCLNIQQSCAQDPNGEASLETLRFLIDQQAEEIRQLRQRLDQSLPDPFSPAPPSNLDAAGCDQQPAETRRLPVLAETPVDFSCDSTGDTRSFFPIRYFCEYDKGFIVARSVSEQNRRFEMKINGWIQMRHHAFTRDTDSWTDQSGITRPIYNRNTFDIERARLVISGFAQDPRLTYFMQIDGDTDGQHNLDFLDFIWSWKCNDSFQLQFGKRKVTAGRQWLLGARQTRLIDRPLACEFFRPDRTVGLFAVTRLGETGHLDLMVGGGYNTVLLDNTGIDDRLTFAATHYFDPFGPFGNEIVDHSHNPKLLARLGHSFAYSPQESRFPGLPFEEANFLRLSDGTRLTQTGALGAGSTVSAYDIFFYGLDGAFKCCGWSLNTEVFLRWIEDIRADGPTTDRDLFQHGFYVEGGYFLIPDLLDINVRYSAIHGEFANREEYAMGANWFPMRSPRIKLSFDVTSLDGSPVQNPSIDVLAGDDGVLFRSQFQAEF